ncbi:arginine-tRNA-protein transferase [Arthroderma uncinatum]|uniref:arginine-tRNA-protein transferase n=1 Tax=Arthroderma uncinatum TaxID=74035 RepID=UPI00144ACD7D|nr:arginine-tRNA-protein transferase [Arthroderma uncinatum]KAF3480523.1 arginine-tRNA-protein transferase [Arthroderma uncinatum]
MAAPRDLKPTEISYFSPMGYQRNTCGYCKRTDGSASYYASSTSVRVEEYEELMNRGWRRSGSLYYKPNLARSCCPHYTMRLNPKEYKPRRDQKKALNHWNSYVLGASEKNHHNQTFDLSQRVHEMEYANLSRPINPKTKTTIEPAHKFEVNIESDSFSVAKYNLFLRYQTTVHKEHESRWKHSDFKRFLCTGIKQKTVKESFKSDDGPVTIERKLGSYHQCYRLDGALIAVAVLDLLPHSVSSVYIFYDPDYEKFELGKLSAMREIALTDEMRYQHYYMDPESLAWGPLDGEYSPKLDKRRYVSLAHDRKVASSTAPDQPSDTVAISTVKRDMPDKYADIPNEESMSLFDLHMPGVLTLEELRTQVDLDHWHLLIRGMLVEMTDLVGWETSSMTNPQAIKGIVAELAAALGPKVWRETETNIFRTMASTPEPREAQVDAEKCTVPTESPPKEQPVPEKDGRLLPFLHAFWSRLASWGVELRGIVPVGLEERTDKNVMSLFFLWFTISCNLLPVITGMVGTLSLKLNLRDASLVIIFFNLLCTVPPAYLSIFGPKTGMRQMIQARYSYGIYLVNLVVLLNMSTMSGFTIINCVIGGQTLSAVNSGSLSVNVGIVIVALVALFISFFGYRVLYHYERWAWIPTLISLVVATGCGGKYLANQHTPPPATAVPILSFGGLLAGFLIPWAALSSDYCAYFHPSVSSKRIFTAVYMGLCLPNIPLMILGAAIGGAVPNVPSWSAAYETGSVGGIFAAMLSSAGGFGKFVIVLLTFSTLGNIAASIYSITLNFQILLPILVRVPRAVFAVVFIAIVIPVSMRAAVSFFVSLENFAAVISYWSATFVAVIAIEHIVFRKRGYDSYDPSIWNNGSALPSGIPAVAAGANCEDNR